MWFNGNGGCAFGGGGEVILTVDGEMEIWGRGFMVIKRWHRWCGRWWVWLGREDEAMVNGG